MKTIMLIVSLTLAGLMLIASVSAAAPAKITIDLNDMSTRDALAALFDKAGVNYVLKDGITGRIEKLSFRDVKFETALDAVIKTSDDLDYTVEDGVYMVGPKQQVRKAEAPAAVEKPAEPAKPETEASAAAGQPPELQPEGQAPPEEIQDYGPYPYVIPPPPFISGGVINDFYSGPFGYVPFQYGGVIHSPAPGYITPPYSFGLYSNMPMQPPRFWAPWRGPSPRVNGIPIF